MKKRICSKPSLKDIEKIILKAGLDISKKDEGALFIISDRIRYKRMLKQKVQPFSIFECGARKLLPSIGMIDGAVIINKNGIVIDYGVKVAAKKVLKGYGTRHSAAYSASFEKETISILVSQEEKKIKIFKKGKLIAQIDALEKNVEKHVSRIHEILESAGVGALSTIGISFLAPELGIAILPGIVLFGVPYYILRKLRKR
jgi:DNA integrity scanning protein DisA with diadenylate cyclase activity